MIGDDDLRVWVDAYIEAQQDSDLLKEGIQCYYNL